MDYSNFEVEDFASDDDFIRWVVDDAPDAALFWESYRISNPDAALRIDKARQLLLDLREVEQTYPGGQVERTWDDIRSRISRHPSKKSFSILKIAASVSVMVIFSVLWYGFRSGYFSQWSNVHGIAKVDEQDFIEQINTTGKVIEIRLSDGSVVSLENNSRLKYYKDYKKDPYRKVFLTGEAFFNIAKNPLQPFLVYANEVVTKVLGTSFSVKAYDNEGSVVVSVKEGKVSVYSKESQREKGDTIESEMNGVVLMPNQQVLYERTEGSFNKTLVERPEIIKEEALQFNFEFHSTPAKEVFEVLAEAYGIEIIFDEEGLENCYLTAPLGGEEPLFEKLKIVCRTIGATYELIDAKIVVSSKGCGSKEASDPLREHGKADRAD